MNKNKKISLIGLAMALMLLCNLLLPPQFSFATETSSPARLDDAAAEVSPASGAQNLGNAGETNATQPGAPSPETVKGDTQPAATNDATGDAQVGTSQDAPPIAVNLQNAGTNATGKTWDYDAIVENTLKVSTAVNNKVIYAGEVVDFNLTFNLKTSSARADAERVKPTDTIKLLLSEHFTPSDIKTEQEKDIFIGSNKVGTALFSTENSKLYVTMQFDKSTDFGQSDAGVAITAKLKYSDTSINNQVQATLAKKTFDVYPAPTVTYPMSKSGDILPNGNIKWTIVVNSLENNLPKSLRGAKLVDDLTKVGDYVPDSFKVGGKTPKTGLNVSGRTLEYRFGETTEEQTITFETKIQDYFTSGTGAKIITNTAKLQKLIGDNLAEAKAEVPIPEREWISKSGKFIDNTKEIEWTIVINEAKAELGNITLKEDLTYGQEFISGYYTIGDSQDQNQIDIPTEKAQKAYLNIRFTNVNKKITVKLTSSYEYEGKFTNTASIFNTNSGSGKMTSTQTASKTLVKDGVGSYGFEKVKMPHEQPPDNHKNQTVKFDADLREGTLQWKFLVNNNVTNDLFIYDLLVYEKNNFNKNDFISNPNWKIIEKLPPSYGMKYHSGLDDSHVIPLTANGKKVADLIKIPVNYITAIENGKKAIAFKTKVVDPKIIFKESNAPTQMINSAFLVSGETPVAFSEDSMWFQNSMIYKEAFNPDFSTANNLNHEKRQGYRGKFNYSTREVLYRISVNASNADYTKYITENDAAKPIIIDEQLPSQMQFIDFDGIGVPYQIFEGVRGVNGVDVLPKQNPVALTAIEIEQSGIKIERPPNNPNNIRFTFNSLNKPYYIVLRTKLTDAKYAEFLSQTPSNQSYHQVVNQAFFRTDYNESGNKVRAGADMAIYPTSFEKHVEAIDGMLRWKIVYKPYLLASADSVSITDIIPTGVQLPLGADGQPMILTDPKEADKSKIKIQSYTIKTESHYYKYELDSSASNTLDVKYSVEDGQGKLTFTPQDKSKGYIIEYFTPYSAEAKAGMKITNEAKLWVNHSEHKSASASHTIESGFSISAWLSKIGGVQITKVDADEPSKKLSGAVFELRDKQNNIVKQGATNEKGELIFAPLAVGEYTLREITAPSGYDKSEVSYTISVTQNGKDKQTVVTKTGESNPVENNPLIEISNKKKTTTPPPTGGGNQGGNPPTPPSTGGGSGGENPNNNQSNVRPNPPTPPKQEEDKTPNENPIPEPIPVNPNPSNENPPQNPNSNPSTESPSGSGSGGRRIIGYTADGEPIYDDVTPFGNREKEEQAKKSKQSKNKPGRIGSAPKTGAGQISLSSIGLASGSVAILIIALRERFLTKKRINK